MELTYSELAKRDVINIADGRCLGRIIDLKLVFPTGKLVGIFVPGRRNRGLFKFFDKTRIYIEESRILKIGGDVILVDMQCGDNCLPSININTPNPPKPKPKPCPPPCPPCPPKPNGYQGIDLSSLVDQNGRIDLDDY